MRILTNNFGLKLLALAIACTLSAYVYYELGYPVPDVLEMRLRAVGLDSKLELKNQLPGKVAVFVRGPYRSIRRLRNLELAATVDLHEMAQPGAARLAVTVPHFGDVVVSQLQPSEVEVEVDWSGKAEQTNTLAVAIALQGESPAYEYSLAPPQVKLSADGSMKPGKGSGAEIAATLDVTGLAPGEYHLAPQLRLPAQLDNVRLSPGWVTLTVAEKGH